VFRQEHAHLNCDEGLQVGERAEERPTAKNVESEYACTFS